MANKELKEYIKAQMQNGLDYETIKNTLTSKGWTEQQITDAYNEFNSFSSETTESSAIYNEDAGLSIDDASINSGDSNTTPKNKLNSKIHVQEDKIFNKKNLLILGGLAVSLFLIIQGISVFKILNAQANIEERLSRCEALSEATDKKFCYANILAFNNDTDVCDNIPDESMKKACEVFAEKNTERLGATTNDKLKIFFKKTIFGTVSYAVLSIIGIALSALLLLWVLKINKVYWATIETAIKIISVTALLSFVFKLGLTLIKLAFLSLYPPILSFLIPAYTVISSIGLLIFEIFLIKKFLNLDTKKSIFVMLTLLALLFIAAIILYGAFFVVYAIMGGLSLM